MTLSNSVGVIDAGYRGEWQARFLVATHVGSPRTYKAGDRIGQIQFQRVPEVRFEQVDSLNDSPRGAGSFGSSGK
ncbi:dUTPase [Hymenobacter psychrophilus]|uniref:dUTPase n=2 Tax=Hymenobacter psychrophilus TaxID=651662 RepID=A0A1H3PD62_9BACT|nr:dUTPase [Hymenobacter psychrophilus]